MRPIIKESKRFTDVGGDKKLIKTIKRSELCGNCKHTLNHYWHWCPFCGEPIERDEQK